MLGLRTTSVWSGLVYAYGAGHFARGCERGAQQAREQSSHTCSHRGLRLLSGLVVAESLGALLLVLFELGLDACAFLLVLSLAALQLL